MNRTEIKEPWGGYSSNGKRLPFHLPQLRVYCNIFGISKVGLLERCNRWRSWQKCPWALVCINSMVLALPAVEKSHFRYAHPRVEKVISEWSCHAVTESPGSGVRWPELDSHLRHICVVLGKWCFTTLWLSFSNCKELYKIPRRVLFAH